MEDEPSFLLGKAGIASPSFSWAWHSSAPPACFSQYCHAPETVVRFGSLFWSYICLIDRVKYNWALTLKRRFCVSSLDQCPQQVLINCFKIITNPFLESLNKIWWFFKYQFQHGCLAKIRQVRHAWTIYYRDMPDKWGLRYSQETGW